MTDSTSSPTIPRLASPLPETASAPPRQGTASESPQTHPSDHLPSAAFAQEEGPTLASSSQFDSDGLQRVSEALKARLTTMEERLELLEQELAAAYDAIEHLSQGVEQGYRQGRSQRRGRYLLWGAMLLVLGTLWWYLRLRTQLQP